MFIFWSFYPANLLNYIIGFNSRGVYWLIICEKKTTQFTLCIPILKTHFLLCSYLIALTRPPLLILKICLVHVDILTPMAWCIEKNTTLFLCYSYQKLHNFSPVIKKKQQANPNWGTFNKITDRHLHMCQGHESQGNRGELLEITWDSYI